MNSEPENSAGPRLAFVPLREADSALLHSLLNDPRVTRHMPLAEPVDLAWVEDWKNAKSSLWPDPQQGPWAVSIDGQLAGWVGLQPDGDNEVELAIVLNVWAWRHGTEIANEALRRWGEFDRESQINVYFPTSRPIELLIEKLGLELIGRSEFGGHEFVKLRLLRSSF